MSAETLAPRTADVQRETKETQIRARLCLDGTGRAEVATGLAFLDHMLVTWARFARFDLELDARGDLAVDDHHTVEDVALVLGACINKALGERRGIARFGHAYAPLDEALVRAVVDLSGRPFARVELDFVRPNLGAVATENLVHFFQSLATAAALTLHLEELAGANDHHRSEAAFKALGLALRAAVRRDANVPNNEVPSTKGVLG